MRIALLELIRKPSRFIFVGAALAVLSVLMLFLGGLLDGLYLNSTGAIRALDADLVVFSDDSRQSFLRSSIEADELDEIAQIDGVAEVGGTGISLLGVRIPGEDDLADGAVVGYELPSGVLPGPPSIGEGYADRSLEDAGADLGDTVTIGPAETPVEIVGWVDDSNYLLQSGIWVAPETWRAVQNDNRPDAPLGDSEFQVAVVRLAADADREAVAAQIDLEMGNTETLTDNEAVNAIPGIEEQERTFTAVIAATVLVAALVVTLFFALLTVERTALYAVLKALGGSSSRLILGVGIQAVLITTTAFLVGGIATFGLAQILPPEIPAEFQTSRIIGTLAALLLTSLAGSLISFRRINRIEPASALGAGV